MTTTIMPPSSKPFPRLTHLGNMPIKQFLSEYWQKKPLLIRNAFPALPELMSKDALLTSSLEASVTSRLIEQVRDQKQTSPLNWSLSHGPITQEQLKQLPDSHWTLLVQNSDAIEPQVHQLRRAFSFIPSWRMEDIMVSYASDQGGVGPHFDYYDVFLIQGEGQRRWRIGQRADEQSTLVEGQAMKILSDFQTQDEWILQTGDMLYIPPNISHWGESIGESTCYSVGFRSLNHGDFLSEYVDSLTYSLDEQARYSDPNIREQVQPGEITEDAIDRLRAILNHYCNDREALATWFGEYASMSNNSHNNYTHHPAPIDEEALINSTKCQLSPLARAVFYTEQHAEQDVEQESCLCFVNGFSYPSSLDMAKALSNYEVLIYSDLTDEDQQTLLDLASQDLLVPCR
ncbi:MAG: cupin [Alteromonadaceae bacterium]|nr:MAG: cupin [Alteromonadaceae bacterium]